MTQVPVKLDNPKILLRTGEPASVVAARLAAGFGFLMERRINGAFVLRGPAATTSGSVPRGAGVGAGAIEPSLDPRLELLVARVWDADTALELYRGFDTEVRLYLSPVGLREGDYGRAAWGLLDAIIALLQVPTLLTNSFVSVVAAWNERLGLRRFETRAYAVAKDRAVWGEYEQPPVTTGPPMVPSAADPLGWRVLDWPAEDDLPGQLYQRILTDPDDDQVRLAYADAVAGEHPEHAELIRAQLAYSRDRRAGVEWPADKQATVSRLARTLRDQLLPTFGSGLLGREPQVKRGFLESMWNPADTFIRLGGLLAGRVPLRMAYLTDVAESLDELVASPNLSRLVGLSVGGNQIGDEGLARLLRSPYLGRLRYLSVENTGVTAAGIEALAASAAVPQLRYVNADWQLRLNPVVRTDYDGTIMEVEGGGLGQRLAQRYDRPWLHWQSTPLAKSGWVPAWDEV